MSVDFFLKIDGIEGESQDKTHKNEIQLESWSWGQSNTGSMGAGGGRVVVIGCSPRSGPG